MPLKQKEETKKGIKNNKEAKTNIRSTSIYIKEEKKSKKINRKKYTMCICKNNKNKTLYTTSYSSNRCNQGLAHPNPGLPQQSSTKKRSKRHHDLPAKHAAQVERHVGPGGQQEHRIKPTLSEQPDHQHLRSRHLHCQHSVFGF